MFTYRTHSNFKCLVGWTLALALLFTAVPSSACNCSPEGVTSACCCSESCDGSTTGLSSEVIAIHPCCRTTESLSDQFLRLECAKSKNEAKAYKCSDKNVCHCIDSTSPKHPLVVSPSYHGTKHLGLQLVLGFVELDVKPGFSEQRLNLCASATVTTASQRCALLSRLLL